MVVETTMKRFGRLHILVNNAGRGMKYISSAFLTESARFWEIEPETWRMLIDTNVNGPFLMARNAAPVIMVPPLLWLASPDSDGMTGRRLVATRWRSDLDCREAAEAASEAAGW